MVVGENEDAPVLDGEGRLAARLERFEQVAHDGAVRHGEHASRRLVHNAKEPSQRAPLHFPPRLATKASRAVFWHPGVEGKRCQRDALACSIVHLCQAGFYARGHALERGERFADDFQRGLGATLRRGEHQRGQHVACAQGRRDIERLLAPAPRERRVERALQNAASVRLGLAVADQV